MTRSKLGELIVCFLPMKEKHTLETLVSMMLRIHRSGHGHCEFSYGVTLLKKEVFLYIFVEN